MKPLCNHYKIKWPARNVNDLHDRPFITELWLDEFDPQERTRQVPSNSLVPVDYRMFLRQRMKECCALEIGDAIRIVAKGARARPSERAVQEANVADWT